MKFPHRQQLLRVSPIALMVLGASILFYVCTQYWTMYSGQRHLAQEWEQQQMAIDSGTMKPPQDGLTRIFVPKIDLDAVVVEGTSQSALLRGPGHLEDTPAPGDSGNSVISAHRDTFFRRIYELKKGDVVRIERNGRSYVYEVTGKKIVQPTDLSVIKPTTDPRLTLITCYPTYFIGPAPERLVVFAKRMETDHAELGNIPPTQIKAQAVAAH
jgi:LPXTG-site transpeptidase (sortase) family protein